MNSVHKNMSNYNINMRQITFSFIILSQNWLTHANIHVKKVFILKFFVKSIINVFRIKKLYPLVYLFKIFKKILSFSYLNFFELINEIKINRLYIVGIRGKVKHR